MRLPHSTLLAALTLLLAAPMALSQPGTVTAWGSNSSGQTNVPAGLSNVVQIDAQGSFAVALKDDGTVVAWGYNVNGETNVPAGLSDVAYIDAGGRQTLALKTDGTVVGWGRNANGQLNIPSGLVATDISSGQDQSCAVRLDATVICWGSNSGGQTNVPAGLTDVVSVESGFGHTAALKADGTVVTWGFVNGGPIAPPAALSDVVAINAGWDYTLALKSDGTVVAWGANSAGQSTVPAGLTDVVAVTAGHSSSAALKADGTYVSWGNAYGAAPALTNTGQLVFANDFALALEGAPSEALSVSSGTSVPGASVYWPTDTAALAIDAVSADGLYGLRADLGYDMTRLAFVANTLEAGSLFADGAPQVIHTDFADTGVFEFTTGRTDGNAAAGSGTTATLDFLVADNAAPGLAEFTLSGVDAIDPAGDAFTFAEVSGGSFMIGGVWPGDMDNDCTVNVLDLFPIATNYGAEGPARQGDRDITWGAKAFSPWGGFSGHDDFPQSFADSDGNGEVDASDLLALLVNYGDTHGAETGCTPPAETLTMSGPATLALDGAVGSTVAIDISMSAPASELLGAAVALDHAATGATVLAIEGGTLMAGALEVVQIGDTIAEAAFAHRGAAEAVSGEGSLVRIVARIDALGATLALTGMHLSTVGGGTTAVDPSSGGVVTSQSQGVATDGAAPAALDVALAPNPARGFTALALTAPEAGEATIDMYDALGRRVAGFRQVVTAGSTRIALPVADLAPGLYVVRTQVAGQTMSRTLTIAR